MNITEDVKRLSDIQRIHFCIKNLVKAWLIYRHDEPHGFTADEWYRDTFKGEEK